MLKNKTALALNIALISIALSACTPKQSEQALDAEQSSSAALAEAQLTLQGQTEKLVLNLPECEGKNCPEFSVERLQSNQFVLDGLIDQAILSNLEQMLSPVQHEELAGKTEKTEKTAASEVIADRASKTAAQLLAEQVQPYLAHFLEVDKELKDLGASHKISLSISPRILNSEPPLATVVINSSSYLGGAHGASAQQYYNFDLIKQKHIRLKDILQPNQQEQLNKLAYAAFKTWVIESKLANNMAEYEQVWKFKLSDNFYLGKQGLILQYGEYEIGPFAVGLPRLVIPYDQLQQIIKPEYLPAAQPPEPVSNALAVTSKKQAS